MASRDRIIMLKLFFRIGSPFFRTIGKTGIKIITILFFIFIT